MTPDRLGPYRIVSKLGRGGMGMVFLGEDDASKQTAAIKLLSGDMAVYADFRERFKAEIDTLRTLNHPNIVRISGYGEQENQFFYVMEYVSGGSLETQLSRGRVFNWREVAQFGVEMAGALRHAHAYGVLHRDIKPGNLLITDAGSLKLSDFGIVRLFDKARLTGVGNILGTAEFMAPEQAEGRTDDPRSDMFDPRSDLYSLGAVLYVLLARRRLFDAHSLMEMIAKQRSEKPAPLRSLVPDVPKEFAEIIHRLLEKDPDCRFKTATVLQRRLEGMLESHSLPAAAECPAVTVDPAPVGPAPHPDPPPLNPLAVTIDATQYAEPVAPASADPRRTFQANEQPTSNLDQPVARGVQVPSAQGAVSPARGAADDAGGVSAPPAEGSALFVPARPGELDQKPKEPSGTTWISPHTWALAIGLLAIGLFAYYMLQPPSADALYRRVQRQTEGGSIEALEQAEDDIKRFRDHFPGDPRSQELDGYMERIETARLERQLELQAKGVKLQAALSPVQRSYIDAMQAATVNIDQGIVKFRATADLFGSRQQNAGSDWRCILLARRRAEELARKAEALHKEELTALRQCLDSADELAKSEPAKAAAIRRGAIELFGDKPWAKDLVQRARDELKKSEP
jgi:serine/threonine-protein kinase